MDSITQCDALVDVDDGLPLAGDAILIDSLRETGSVAAVSLDPYLAIWHAAKSTADTLAYPNRLLLTDPVNITPYGAICAERLFDTEVVFIEPVLIANATPAPDARL